MIVVDVGCAPRGEDISIEPLLARFHPDEFYGFDPAVKETSESVDGMRIELRSTAAWIREGQVRYREDGIRSSVGDGDELVPCFSLADWIETLPDDEEVVLKIDAEGAEYALLRDLHWKGVDERLALLLVEWHAGPLDLPFRCPVEEWA